MQPRALDLYCIPAVDGVAVAPCSVVNGVAYAPVMGQEIPFNPDSGPELFAWSFSLLGGLFCLGLVIGSIIRIIRSA